MRIAKHFRCVILFDSHGFVVLASLVVVFKYTLFLFLLLALMCSCLYSRRSVIVKGSVGAWARARARVEGDQPEQHEFSALVAAVKGGRLRSVLLWWLTPAYPAPPPPSPWLSFALQRAEVWRFFWQVPASSLDLCFRWWYVLVLVLNSSCLVMFVRVTIWTCHEITESLAKVSPPKSLKRKKEKIHMIFFFSYLSFLFFFFSVSTFLRFPQNTCCFANLARMFDPDHGLSWQAVDLVLTPWPFEPLEERRILNGVSL